ncbi:imidazolonepropionase [Pseudomonas sp. S9]|uniref:imidazolonepropionase n=1 Tax=Pseudomonas sp. S9 TaxID=686578 RepID=UPI00025567F7|nr:imidazolonepropionase [Pseudomonas sp. S9]
MPLSSQDAKLWRDVSVFDGLQTLPEPMAVLIRGGVIAGLWPESVFALQDAQGAQEVGRGGVMTPGLVDCHTHLVFAGNRAAEFELRLEGASYAEIARAGGGIISSVRAVRDASEEALLEQTLPRLQALIDDGVTSVEIKSGYGLTTADELKMLRVARRLAEQLPVHVTTTLLGAHALPPEFADNSDGYISLVCEQMIPAAAREGLADAVDVFCENIAFSPAQTERVFMAAQAHGLAIKVHAEQLSNQGASALAARYGALSADHIEFLDEAGVKAMAQAGTVATLLPGAFHTLRETQLPPIQLLRDHGVPMALASDANPGTSPICFPTLMLNLACTLFRMTPREALAGATAHAATAIGRKDLGRIAVGAPANLCVWDVQQPAELAYAVQPGRMRQRVFAGVLTHDR